MAFAITDFANQYTGDYARPNLFEVEIGELSNAKMLIKTATLPASTVGAIEVPYQNRKLKLPGDRTFADWSVTIMNDETYALRKLLLSWQKDITGFTSFSSAVAANSTHKELVVRPYNRDGTASSGIIKLYGWPSDIGTIDLSWDTADAVQEYTVTFSISWDDGGTPVSVVV